MCKTLSMGTDHAPWPDLTAIHANSWKIMKMATLAWRSAGQAPRDRRKTLSRLVGPDSPIAGPSLPGARQRLVDRMAFELLRAPGNLPPQLIWAGPKQDLGLPKIRLER